MEKKKYYNEFHEMLGEDQLYDIETKVEWTKERLIAHMDSLRYSLEREINLLKTDPKHVPNSLGVVQGAGSNIDVLCSEYYQFLEQRTRFRRIIRRYEKMLEEESKQDV